MITYIIPFYSDGSRLEGTLKTLRNAMQHMPIKQVILAHNGPVMSASDLSKLEQLLWPDVEIVHTDERGVGAGCKLAIPKATQDYLIITGSDLPFGFTDFENFQKNLKLNPAIKVMIGSKGHSDSIVKGNNRLRKLMSNAFMLIRKLALGLNSPRDTQGSIFISTSLAKVVNENCYINNYLYTMELVTRAQKMGHTVVEVPIVCDMRAGGTSSVSVVKDTIISLLEILKFAVKLRMPNNSARTTRIERS